MDFSLLEKRFFEAAFIRELGIELVSASPGEAATRLAVVDRFLQQDGFVHAGVVATLADHTGGASAWTLVKPHQTVLTVEFKVNFLNPARGPVLDCKAKVLRAGGRITTSEADVYSGDGSHAARLNMTVAIVDTDRIRKKG
ncbi:MAG: PaaI family thioesterase [Deltaproteobacteria bacterium]|nr:PaaI family thioesterase [Deltaproteobacteria bacterium]